MDAEENGKVRREAVRAGRERGKAAFHALLLVIRLTAIAALFCLLFLGPSGGGHHLNALFDA